MWGRAHRQSWQGAKFRALGGYPGLSMSCSAGLDRPKTGEGREYAFGVLLGGLGGALLWSCWHRCGRLWLWVPRTTCLQRSCRP